jgi:hypothetical protein
MGITYKIGNSPNKIWNLESRLGSEFENWVFQFLSKELEPYFAKDVGIKQTPGSNDGGKDIIITSKTDIKGVLDQNFYLKGKSQIKIYVECKSTDQSRLRYEEIICNVTKIKQENIDYFVLITNSTIIPSTYYNICEELRINDIEFILLDQYLIAKYIKKLNLLESNEIPLCTDKISFYAEYQVVAEKEDGKNIFDIYLVCRNYSQSNHKTTMRLLTDKNWEIDEPCFSFVIPPNGSYVRKISILRVFSDGIDDLLFQIETEKNESVALIHGVDVKEIFEPPFVGDTHRSIKQELCKNIKKGNELQIFYLWGDAGIGKSRIASEIFKDLNDKGVDFCFYTFSTKNKNPTKKILDFLIKKGYIKIKDFDSNFSEMILSCSNQFRRAVIILDDCHNADKEFFEQIKQLINHSVPITILLCGRTDYSEGEIGFFHFVQWTLDNLSRSGWVVTPFTEDETQKLIRAMINQIPNVVLRKICNMSMNNPLYIVQFIEYLLEAKLVKLVNRNTVGILNVATFCSRVSIPDKISQIYEKRVEHLLKHTNGTGCLEFLLLLTIWGGNLSSDLVMNFIDEDMVNVSELLKRRFIKRGENRNYTFIHESLLIYFKKIIKSNKNHQKQIAEYIFSKPSEFMKQLSQFEIGRLALWAKNIVEAEKCFSSAVELLLSINNHSNYNIDIGIYDYLYDIYNLYKGKKSNRALLKKIISARIYITLHYLTPVNAITECNYGLMLLDKSSVLSDEELFRNTILSLKAHSLLSAGQRADGELILKELQSKWLIKPELFDKETLFDLFDRLSAVHAKNNCYELALNYSNIEMSIAEKFEDKSLTILAHRTISKLFFYNNPKQCKQHLDKAHELSKGGVSIRINLDNLLSEFIFEMTHNKQCNWKQIMNDTFNIKNEAMHNEFSKSVVRAYMVLAVCSLKLSSDKSSLLVSKELFIDKGIDACIFLGIPGHIWQFYNLLAIVEEKLNYSKDHIARLFETVFSMLAKQNLLYIGNRDFCFSNIMAISNIGIFLQHNSFESEFISKMSRITYTGYSQLCDYNCRSKCGYICSTDNVYLKEQYIKAKDKCLLFVDKSPSYILRDEETEYFIPMS